MGSEMCIRDSGEVARMNFESPRSRPGVTWKSPASRGEVGIQVARESPGSRGSECALVMDRNKVRPKFLPKFRPKVRSKFRLYVPKFRLVGTIKK